MAKRFIIMLIEGYQRYLSLDHSKFFKKRNIKFCIFHPSCSEYTKQSIIKFGILKGGILGIARILRCNPFNKAGIDNIKDKFQNIFFRKDE